jgi:hypothetical protein
MSDATQGEGWWQASDGKWYPPEQHPGFDAGATQPIEATPPPTAAMPIAPPPPAPGGPPIGPPPGAPVGPPPGAPGAGSNNTKWIIGGVVAVAVIAIAAFLLLGGDDKKQNVAAASSSSSSKSSSSSSKSSSSSSSSKSSSSSSSLSTSDLQARMLNASDIGPDFSDDTFVVDTGPTNCGQPNARESIPPKGEVGSAASSGVASFQEDAVAFSSSADAQKVLDLILSQTDSSKCPSPTVQGGEPVVFSQPIDRSSEVTTKVEKIFEIDFQTPEAQGQFFVVKDGVAIVTFTFAAQQGTDPSQLPNAMDLVNKGLAKIVNG